MGNRPQGARKMFLGSMITYAIIMVYTVFASAYIVAIQLKSNSLQSTDSKNPYKLGNNIFTNLIVSTISTIGMYFLMSFLYLDPWHMFTSSAQYFALLPSYICTLQVYAFCNTHDVTWGTKGDNVIHTDLGAARTVGGAGGGVVEVEMPSEQLDIDSGYDEALRNLRDRLYYRAVRTYMVAIWMIANAILAMAVSEAYSSTHVADNFYLKFILWSVAAVALFRAIGSSVFQVLRIIAAIVEGRLQAKFEKIFGGGDEDSKHTSSKSQHGGGSGTVGGGITSESGLSVVTSKLSEKFSWLSGSRKG
jgi:chitin synthase